MNFQFYKNDIKQIEPIGEVSLSYFINSVKNPTKEVEELFDKIRSNPIKEERNVLKSSTYAFTPSVFVEGSRKYSDIKYFTGIMVVEFDNISDAEGLKNILFENYKFIITAFISPSGKGVKTFWKIPICKSIEEYKGYFRGVSIQMKHLKGFDRANLNCVLPLYHSVDKKLLYRPDAHTFDVWAYPPKEDDFILDENKIGCDKDINGILMGIRERITSIEEGGYAKVHKDAFLLGGFVGGNKISYTKAHNFLKECIEDMGVDDRYKNIYINNLRNSINKGIKKPIVN